MRDSNWHRSVRVVRFWLIGAGVTFGLALVAAGALYGLALIALYDTGTAPRGEPAGGDVSMNGAGLVVTADSDGAARVYHKDRLVAVLRGHRARIVHATFTARGDAVLSVDAGGMTRITRVKAAMMHHMADTSGTTRMARTRLWEPYVGRASRWALSVVAQILPLHIPKHRRGGRGAIFKDCAICPEMVEIKPGSFLMGSPWFETGRDDDEGPRRLVTIKRSFAVGRFEVTFAEWDAAQDDPDWQKHTGIAPLKPDDMKWGRGRRPVINVSWNDARAYVKWLSKKTGHKYRLLTEAEWEYAARAGTTTRFSWGNTFDSSKARSDSNTVPVGQYGPNKFGLYNMHGKPWELVHDCYKVSYKDAPTDGRPVLDTSGCIRVVRGRHLSISLLVARSAKRFNWNAVAGSEIRMFNIRSSDVGFRVARTLQPLFLASP